MSGDQGPAVNEVSAHSALWTSDRDGYVLVRQPVADNAWFYDIYRSDGTYATLQDERVNRQVAERMVAAGVPVLEPDAWVRTQKVQTILKRLGREPDQFIVVRYREPDDGLELLYDTDANCYRIHEPEVRRLLLNHVVANGSLVVTLDRDVEEHRGGVRHQWNELVVEAHTERPEHSTRIFGVIAYASFDPWYAWRLLRHWGEGGAWTYSAELVYWHFGGPLPFREQVQAPPEHRWRCDIIRHSLVLDCEEGDELMRRLCAIRIPPCVDEFMGGSRGKDGTTYRMTIGEWGSRTEWTWWQDGPDEWQELIQFAHELYERLDALADTVPKRYGMGYYRFL